MILAMALPILLAFLLIQYWTKLKPSTAYSFIQINLAVGMALGISSLVFCALWTLLGPPTTAFYIIETSLYLIGIGLAVFYSIQRGAALQHKNLWRYSVAPDSRWLCWSFAAVFALFVVVFLAKTASSPLGDWDAWAIWNMRARFLYRAGEDWPIAFSPLYSWSHPDYPLLLPSNVVRMWFYGAGESSIAPSALALLFSASTVGLLVSALAYLRDTTLAFIAGLILLSVSQFIQHGTSQFADIPLAFFLLATLVSFYLYESTSYNNRKFLLLAGIMAGCALWTKNEGALMFLVVSVVFFAVTVWNRGWKTAMFDSSYFFLGAVPALILFILFKLTLAGENDLVAGQTIGHIIDSLSDFSRYILITTEFFKAVWELLNGRLLAIALCWFALGRLTSNAFTTSERLAAATLFALIFGYFLVYVLTPHDLAWHLNTSLERLMIQLLPSALFSIFMQLRVPATGESKAFQ